MSAGAEQHVVAAEEAGRRLDRVLAGRYPDRSRSALQRLVREGHVTVSGREVKPSEPVRAGETIEIHFPPVPPETLIAEPIALSVLYEDDDLLVLDKPAGLVVHPGAGNETGTLVHALLARQSGRAGLSGIGGPKRPGIVHRLDRGTSGLMIVARTDRAHLALALQFRSRDVEKTYQALVWGRPRGKEGRIEAAIGRDPQARKKMSTRAPRGRAAVSRWSILSELAGFTLLVVRPETGRTHQIRVHMQTLGHPIVGDERYGGAGWRGVPDPQRRKALRDFRRLALHAWRLTFRHPVTGVAMRLEAPLPQEFRDLLQALREDRA